MARSPLTEVIDEVRANARDADPFLAVILDDAVFYLERLAQLERRESEAKRGKTS